MKLLEHESKEIFKREGIPCPKGFLAFSPLEVKKYVKKLNKPVVIKSQLPIASRMKAGGIKFAETAEEAEKVASELFKLKINKFKVSKVLVEEKVDIKKELYLSITIDRYERKYVYLASTQGGIDIENLAKMHPEKICKVHVDPQIEVKPFDLIYITNKLGLTGTEARQFREIAGLFYDLTVKYDCELVESNPLAINGKGNLIAVDARMIIDDNSLFRHPKLKKKLFEEELTSFELKAMESGFSFVELDGEIGVIANGAGLTMASMDSISLFGGKPANFLDIGGGATSERVKTAVNLQLKHPKVKGVLINIMGGITRCDEVARGLVEAVKETGIKKPITVRMMGTREEEGKEILRKNGISYLETMDEAAEEIVKLVKGIKIGNPCK